MRSRAWVAALLAVGIFMVAAHAENTVETSWGSLSIGWAAAGFLSVDIRLSEDVPQPEEAMTATWVITEHAHRFADDIYAWQIHFSQEFDNFMIVPNDFLATRAFTLVDVGIVADADHIGTDLHVEIPEVAFSRPLVAIGDVLDIHAIWVQLEPLFTVAIPEKGPVAESGEQPVGVGGAVVGAEGEDSAIGVEYPIPGEPELGYDWLPTQTVFAQGEAIEHRFILLDPGTGEPAEWASATINLLRIPEEGPRQIVLFEVMTGDPSTGVFEYRIDASALNPGNYELIIWTSAEPVSRRLRIEITAP
ncbi:hypothetical protein JW848_07100 [Candidatus Bipolaricaulota bacterium]|nr:hypothetical protein [Candidatus Bipolaricaulota bacterium]